MIRINNYIEIKYSLIKIFLIEIKRNILDVSYTITDNEFIIQVVLIDGTELQQDIEVKIKEAFKDKAIKITKIYITKEQFNENKGNWNPLYYKWLTNVLFSKAEIK